MERFWYFLSTGHPFKCLNTFWDSKFQKHIFNVFNHMQELGLLTLTNSAYCKNIPADCLTISESISWSFRENKNKCKGWRITENMTTYLQSATKELLSLLKRRGQKMRILITLQYSLNTSTGWLHHTSQGSTSLRKQLGTGLYNSSITSNQSPTKHSKPPAISTAHSYVLFNQNEITWKLSTYFATWFFLFVFNKLKEKEFIWK